MITVTRIAGESYNLQTGEMLPKALVLSNGAKEYFLYVDEETAAAVLQLLVEDTSSVEHLPPSRFREESVEPSEQPKKEPPNKEPLRKNLDLEAPAAQPPPMAVVEGAPEQEEEEYEREPGEEYNDPATGAASL